MPVTELRSLATKAPYLRYQLHMLHDWPALSSTISAISLQDTPKSVSLFTFLFRPAPNVLHHVIVYLLGTPQYLIWLSHNESRVF